MEAARRQGQHRFISSWMIKCFLYHWSLDAITADQQRLRARMPSQVSTHSNQTDEGSRGYGFMNDEGLWLYE